MDSFESLAHTTTEFPGCGGVLRQHCQDFKVEEIPLYLSGGTGEHIYLHIQKRGISTGQARRILGEVLGVPGNRIGHAGLKDSRAVSTQWISLHSHEELPLERLNHPQLTILSVSRHTNKLRPGHLRGNRFCIRIRQAHPPDTFPTLLARLQQEGFPNYFGPQRFGAENKNPAWGKSLLHSSRKTAPHKARFLLNAYQAQLFNRLLTHRIRETGALAKLLCGDLAIFHRSASFFLVQHAELEVLQQRARAGELSPSAPLFGYNTSLAQGEPGHWESTILSEEGLSLGDFRHGEKRYSPKGERRSVRAFPSQLEWRYEQDAYGPCLKIAFTLPAGVYATSFLREVMKVPPSPPAGYAPALAASFPQVD